MDVPPAAAASSGSAVAAAAADSNAAAYQSAYQELFGSADDDFMKGAIISHPLFPQLLAAHVACLRVATPLEQQHLIDAALANRHHVAAKYLALLNHMQTTSHPPDDIQQLNYFMADYILLLQSFKDQLHHHLRTQASEAITACQEIEKALFNLTGVACTVGESEGSSSSCVDFHGGEEDMVEELLGLGRLGINAFLPYDIHKTLRDHVRQELKQELKKDYHSKLKEVRDEILRKRRAGKLPEDTTHVLKDWWLSHANWPYPTEEEKAQLMEDTGLELKQINNWFINQRKRNWQSEMCCQGERTCGDTMSETLKNDGE